MVDQVEIQPPGPVPQEALDFFSRKQLRPGFDYRDVWRREHAYAFTVAKATELDVLSTLQLQVELAISEGRTLRQFQKELRPTLEKLGWWGKQEAVDPLTGEVVQAQLGSPRRLRTIFNANMRSAHAAGQWQRAERTKEDLPYLLYGLGPSREHRPEHVAWHGTMLPVTDPWWDSHMPPNGWECKCRVRQVSRAEHSRLTDQGLPGADRRQEINPETGLPIGHLTRARQPVRTTAPAIHLQPWKNKRTGKTEMVPNGIDPGWDTNPGKFRGQAMDKMLVNKLRSVDPQLAKVAKRDMDAYNKMAKGV